MWGLVSSALAPRLSASWSRVQGQGAEPLSPHGPAPITAETSNPDGKHGSPADPLLERERLIALAAHTRSHRHLVAARAATLACLRKER